MEIKKEFCGLNRSQNTLLKKSVLQGEIHNLETYFINVPTGKRYAFQAEQNVVSVLLFTSGKGNIKQGNEEFIVDETAVFVPVFSIDFDVFAKDKELAVLEIVLKLSEDELAGLRNRQEPYFATWSECKKYKEAIKSEKTVNRMLLPENIVPRFCMGAVETKGPDKVGAHVHPMLEQLFFGLEKNDCIVSADEEKTSFRENDLLHIPLGSTHGVSVEDRKLLNYIWMDFFRSQEDMMYIAENHSIEED